MAAQSRCPVCRRELPPHARFCPVCGTGVQAPGAGGPQPNTAMTGLLSPQHMLHNRYIIVKRLAQGGQSAVYLATDASASGARCAIKEMSQASLLPQERERAITHFLREAQILAHLNHPALAHVYEYFTEDDKHYLAMEYVPGHTLEDEMIELGRPLDAELVVRWGVILADVLTYLHAQNPPIIYRDLKPANVMLTPSGALKLIDFGIARRLLPARLRDTAQLGTDGYAPLEQYASKSEPRSDVYALGATLYHLLTGRVPESAPRRSTGDALTPIRAINRGVPEPVERVIMQALSLQPQDRFPGAAAMGEALSRLVADEIELPGAPRQAGMSMVTGGPRMGGLGGMATHPGSGPIPPKLHVWPLRLDGGTLEPGASAVLELEVGNRGGGDLTGHIETNTLSLIVQPPRVDATTTHLQVHIDTSDLVAGPYVCHLAVRTNGGDQIIPVRFVVQPPADGRNGRRSLGS
jgi:serine/threonine-protein kinase